MRFENVDKNKVRDTNYEIIKSRIPAAIRNKIVRWVPTPDKREVLECEFRTNLTAAEKTQFMALFPELVEV